MGKPSQIKSNQFPYYITARTNDPGTFYLPLDKVWRIFNDLLFLTSKIYSLRVHGYVLLPDRYHLILSTPDANLDNAMTYLNREMSKEIGRRSNRINHIFGDRYRSSLLDSSLNTALVYKYILRSSVRSLLCDSIEEYPYSSLYGELGLGKLLMGVAPLTQMNFLTIPLLPYDRLAWLNKKPSAEQEEVIRKSLRKPIFQIAFRYLSSRNFRKDLLVPGGVTLPTERGVYH